MMTASRKSFWRSMLLAAGIVIWSAGAIIHAQAQTPAPKDFLGLVENRSKPLEIEAALAGPEAGGVERYGGNTSWVLVRLGSTALESHFVTVTYERGPETTVVSTAELRKAGFAHILKLEASGDVVLTYQDQTVVGDEALFDIRANKLWFYGNVTLTQKQKIYTGDRLSANLKTGGFAIGRWKLFPRKVLKGPYPPFSRDGNRQRALAELTPMGFGASAIESVQLGLAAEIAQATSTSNSAAVPA